MDISRVRALIHEIRGYLSELEGEIENNPTVNVMVNGASRVRIGSQEIVTSVDRPVPIPDPSRLIDLPDWPVAVEPDILCDEENVEEQVARAEVCVDTVVETDLRDTRFLDYGCGAGWTVPYAAQRGAVLAVGYDPNTQTFPPAGPRYRFTDDSRDLESHGYDVILLYDVLDHADEPVDVLHDVARLLAPGGTVYVQCHPWTSRHGGHLYRQFNKAFAHLYLDHDQLLMRGIRPEFVRTVLRPLRVYRQWFVTAGLAVRQETPRYSDAPLEQFFQKTPGVWSHITRHFAEMLGRHEINDDDIKKILELEFVNYTLQSESLF